MHLFEKSENYLLSFECNPRRKWHTSTDQRKKTYEPIRPKPRQYKRPTNWFMTHHTGNNSDSHT